METVALLYEDYQKELAKDFKNTFLKRASDTDSSRSNDTVIDEVTDMLSTNIAVYTEKLLQRWGFSSGGEGGGGGDVTVTLDDLLKKYLSDNYVTIKGDQEVFGEKDFRKGIRIAGRRLYWDEGNDALVIEGAAYTTRWLSAKGVSPGGGGGGLINLVYGFESLGGTFDNNDNSATFNAFTINEIWKLASSGLTNVTVTGSGNAVTDVIKGSDGRSLTFTKGSTFATKSEFDALNTKFNDFLTGSDADDIINKWSELEVFLQGMKESDNLAVILQSKMDKTAFSKLFTALDASGNEVDPSDDTKTIASIRANFGFWGVDYISAKGVSKGSGGTGGASTLYQLVDVLANDTEDGVEGAAAGKALVFDGTHWRAGDAGLNESQLYSYLTANKYLTQSAADSRYVTSSRKVIAGTGLSGGGALTSDVTLSLGTSGVVAGTYTKVMVDAYGRVTSGTNLSATDIPNLDWSKITTGKPTTLAGYGITDAVTLTTAQTISGQKTFTKNILMNSGIGLSYGGNTVFRNTTGNTVISSYGNEGMIYFRPNGDTSDVGVIQINKQGHLNGVSAGFTGGVSAARLSATEYVQIGDAYLKWDAANNAVYVIKKDGTTPVGFYSTDWLSAKGVSMSGAQTGTLADLNDVEITDPVNGQALKYDAASKKWVNGTIDSFNVNQMWAELKKADSSKIIDASHIPTSVLDGRWVTLSTNQTITGQKTFTQQLKSTVATGVSPLIVSSNTLVNNLNADLLDGYHQSKFLRTDGVNQHITLAEGDGNNEGYRLVLEATVTGGWSVNCMTLLVNSRHSGTGIISLVFQTTNQDSTSYVGSLNYYGSLIGLGYTMWRLFYNTTTKKIRLFWHYYDYNDCKVSILNRRGLTTNISNGTWYTTIPSDSGSELPSYYNRSDTTGSLATSRTLWGQPFNGTANVSGDMTGVGNITMSGDLKIGNGTSPNTIYFYGTTGDSPGSYNHTFIAERLWGGTESSELVLFKGNNLGNGNEAVNVGNTGPDRIRHIAAAHLFQTYTSVLSGSVESVCTSSALKNLFGIAANRVTSYVPLQSTVASGTAPFIVASNTVVGNLNADMVDGLHLSDFDGRYVNVTGDTMTGNLTMNNTKGFNIGQGTRVVKSSSNWIHGGGDAASVDDANLRFGSWYGIGWYPTISGQTVAQGKNAMWLNVRNGNLDTHGAITAHTNYLAANWDSARRLVLGGGSYTWIDSRDSSNNVLCNIVLQDNKVVIGNYVESSRFVSTVGTGKQPYQCNSTTLNTNLNADLLDGQHGAYYQNRVYDNYVHQYNEYDYIEFLRFVIPSGQNQLRAYVVFDLCRTETGNESSGRAVLRIRRGSDNNAGYIFYVTNFGRSWLPELRCTTDDGITWRIWMKCNKSVYDPYIAVKIVEQYPYGCVTTQHNGTTGTPSGSKYTFVAGLAGLSNAANILVNTRNIFGQPFNGSGDVGGQMTSTSIFVQTGDATLKVYSGRITDARSDGNICLQTSIDATDGQSHSYPTQYQSRCNLSLQPRGGQVYIGQNPDGGYTGYKLTVNGSIKSNGNIIATGAITAKASSSDIRLKTDIQGYDAMGIIRKFRSVKYHWNAIAKENSEVFNHDNWNYGLIAQDLLSEGYSQWVKDAFNDYYTIDYERLIPVVWKGLQEVDDEVTKLKREVARLNKRVKELEKSLCA